MTTTRIITAQSLHLADLTDAAVDVDEVDTLDPGTIAVAITGPADTIRIRTEAGALHVSGDPTSGTTVIQTGGMNIISGNARVGTVIGHLSGTVVVGGGDIIVNGQRIAPEPSAAPARVRITVRTGTPVTIAGAGSYRVGDTRGPLHVTGSGTTVQAGAVASARIRVQGSGDITIVQVTGPRLDVGVSGAGTVSVGGGEVEQMTARVSGASGITYGGTVVDAAELEVSGVGHITVHRVIGSVDRIMSGLGRINVLNR